MTDQAIKTHPLDPCDPDQCYQTMMSERTALITARRESEDNLIKTVIQRTGSAAPTRRPAFLSSWRCLPIAFRNRSPALGEKTTVLQHPIWFMLRIAEEPEGTNDVGKPSKQQIAEAVVIRRGAGSRSWSSRVKWRELP